MLGVTKGHGQDFSSGKYWLGGYFNHENKTWKWEDDTEIDFEKFGELFEFDKYIVSRERIHILFLLPLNQIKRDQKIPFPVAVVV